MHKYTKTNTLIHTRIRKVSVKTDHYFDQGDFGVTVPFCFQQFNHGCELLTVMELI